MSEQQMDLGTAITALVHVGKLDVDPYVIACPACGEHLRTEVRVEWRPMSEVVALFRVSEAEVRAAGAKVDAFGRVESAVPYGTCMGCGRDFNMTSSPEPHD